MIVTSFNRVEKVFFLKVRSMLPISDYQIVNYNFPFNLLFYYVFSYRIFILNVKKIILLPKFIIFIQYLNDNFEFNFFHFWAPHLRGLINEPCRFWKYMKLMTVLTSKFRIFLLKFHMSNLMHFQEKVVHLFLLEKMALRRESVNFNSQK